MKIPILNLDDVDVHEQIMKVAQEFDEWDNAKEFSANDIEETIDTIQALFGYLLKITGDIEKAFEVHNEKLEKRGWKTKGCFKIIKEGE